MDETPPDRLASLRDTAPFAVAALLAWVSVGTSATVNWRGYGIATVLLALCLSSGGHAVPVT